MAGGRKPSAANQFPIPGSAVRRLGFAAFSGLLLAFAYPPIRSSYTAWISIAPLMAVVCGLRPRYAALCGFVYGVAFFTPTLTWLYGTFRVHGDVSPLMSGVALGAIVAAASVFPAMFGWGFTWVAKRSIQRACSVAPFLWVALEFGRTHLPAIGFPWNLLGYTASRSLALAQLTTVGGVWLLSILVGSFNALLFWAIVEWRVGRRMPALVWVSITATLAIVAGFGDRWVPAAAPDHLARLVQTNFPEPDSFPANWLDLHAGEVDELERLSVAPAADGKPVGLVVWPEVPAPFSMQDPKFAARALRIGQKTTNGFLVGVVEERAQPGLGWQPFNSAVLMDPTRGETFVYDKIHLVPFSEYLPWSGYFAFVRRITLQVGDFQQGTEYRVGTLRDGRRFCVYICYEAVFPGEVRKFVSGGAELLVNISNDGWFGRTAGPEQHLEMARVRAIENRRWMLRCTNNGYTVAVDPYGREVARLATDVRGALEAPYAYRSDLTSYTQWGDWVPWLSLAATVFFFVLAMFSRKTSG
jgi:apolipoprotein N-acyltransferase